MPCSRILDIISAEEADSTTMARMSLTTFQNNGAVELMYSKAYIWRRVLEVTVKCIKSDRFKIRIAFDRKTNDLVGWISLGIIRQ